MVPLLAALALQVSRPVWAVAEFRDLKTARSYYGKVAAADIASELAKDGTYEIVPMEATERSSRELRLKLPLTGIVDLSRVGQDLRVSTIVAGEVVDYQIALGGPARAAIRVVAYDVSSGLPIKGALTTGVADFHGGLDKDAIVREAIGRAAVEAVAAMRRTRVPMATIVDVTTRILTINCGSKAGFQVGMPLIVTRGSIQIGTALIAKVEENRAEVARVRIHSIAPGDRVRAVFTPPPLPPPGTSIFDNPLLLRPQ